MNYYPVLYELLSSDRQTDRQTESDAYEPTVQYAQVGSKIWRWKYVHFFPKKKSACEINPNTAFDRVLKTYTLHFD